MLFILFLSEVFLSNGSLNCSLSSLWFLTDLIWHSVRPSLSKHCATRWFHLGKGGYVVRNRAHLTDLLQFIFWALFYFLKQLILTKNGPFLPKKDKVGFGGGALKQKINFCLKWSMRVQMGLADFPAVLFLWYLLWNWQIQVTGVSWVGQSTKMGPYWPKRVQMGPKGSQPVENS